MMCGPTDSQIQVAVDKAVDEAIRNQITESASTIDSEEKVNFYVWGSEYFESIVDIGYTDDNDEFVGIGTGAIISSDGYVITNYHVAVGNEDFTLFDYAVYDIDSNEWIDPKTKKPAQSFIANWVSGSMCYDLALLKLESNQEFSYLDWYGDFVPGLEIFTLGYPSVGQGEMTVSNGVVSSLRYFGDTSWTAPGLYTFGHTAPIFFGNSGSPVLSEDGKIVGINYTAYKEEGESFSISYAIENKKVKEIVNDYLIFGNDYLSIGIDGNSDNLHFYLEEDDDRNLPIYYITNVHPGSIADIAKIEQDELLIFFGDVYVGQDDFSDFGIDGYPLISDLCDLIDNWERSEDEQIELTLYSCELELFYVATLSKDYEPIEPYAVDNPLANFSKIDINKACISS